MTDANVKELESKRPLKPDDMAEADPPAAINSRGVVQSRAEGASLIQVELGLGRNAAILLWLSAFVSAAAIIGFIFTMSAFKTNSAHVNVLQYDLAQIKAQLIEEGLYEQTGH